jgi:hypothetical protein
VARVVIVDNRGTLAEQINAPCAAGYAAAAAGDDEAPSARGCRSGGRASR